MINPVDAPESRMRSLSVYSARDTNALLAVAI
jgi:hypothetical protein